MKEINWESKGNSTLSIYPPISIGRIFHADKESTEQRINQNQQQPIVFYRVECILLMVDFYDKFV